MNNEHMGFTSITRKGLRPLVCCGILLQDIETGRRREETNDRNDGRSTHTRRSCPYTQFECIHSEEVHQSRHARRRYARWPLACQARSTKTLCGKPYQTGNRQKIKPACGWQMTIEKSTAVRLSLMRSGQLARDNPWKPLLIFSIVLAQREVKIRQNMGMR
jgi:hypothetical protein